MKYYKALYKYVLCETYKHELQGKFDDCENKFFTIKDNVLTAKKGYAWDGASGPTIDTKNTMKAGLVHDCLYQGIRLGCYENSVRKLADQELYLILRKEGVCWLRAKVWYIALRLFGKKAGTKGKLSGRERAIEV